MTDGITCEHGRRTGTSRTCCGSTTILTVSHTDKAPRAPITGPRLFKVMLSRWSLTVVTGSSSFRFTSTTRPIHRFHRCLPRRKPPASRCTASSGMEMDDLPLWIWSSSENPWSTYDMITSFCLGDLLPVRRMIQLFKNSAIECESYARNSRRESSDLAPLIHPPCCFSNVICFAATRPPKFLAVHGFHGI
jgi:hypothetical protein